MAKVKFDLEEGQRSPSRSRHGTTGKVLSQGTHMPSIKALSVIVQKLWPRLNLTLKKVKGHRQGHDMVPPERSCHKEHTCQVSKLYL